MSGLSFDLEAGTTLQPHRTTTCLHQGADFLNPHPPLTRIIDNGIIAKVGGMESFPLPTRNIRGDGIMPEEGLRLNNIS